MVPVRTGNPGAHGRDHRPHGLRDPAVRRPRPAARAARRRARRDPRPRPRVAEPARERAAARPAARGAPRAGPRRGPASWPTRGETAPRLPGGVRRPRTRSAARSPASRRSAFGDLSLLVKVGVQFGLFGGAVLHLGTQRHHERLPDATSRRCELPGCFAMTETGHGSNVQQLAHDRDLRRRPPTSSSSTRPTTTRARTTSATPPRDGRMAAVFAQLVVGGESRGVHALLVPLRDEDGTPRARRPDRGLRRQARPQRRRQRPAVVRRRSASRATTCSTATPTVDEEGVYTSADREPRPSASSRCSARSSRAASASAAPRSAPPRSR